MSIIWDLLRETKPSTSHNGIDQVPEVSERRQSSRTSMYVPVFVYGYKDATEPFHQDTNTLEVNANGGLLRLDVPVHHGQKLLVVNRLTQEEQECYVVTLAKRPKRAERHVGVALTKPASEFWRVRR